MERFSYKDSCGICVLRYLKEELPRSIDKQFWFTNKVMLLKQLHQ